MIPRGLTGLILRKSIRDYRNVENEGVRARYGYLEGWISVGVNFTLVVVKIAIGILIASQALFADAIHSLSDVGTSAIVIIGFKISQKPPDRDHPFGYANAELVASLIMSVLLIIAGFELFRSNIFDLVMRTYAPPKLDWGMIFIICLTIIAKEWLGRFSAVLGKMIRSTALETDAWHHRLDAITTVLVVVGIIGASWGIHWLDNATGAVVSLVIIWSGVAFAKKSISPLMGENISEEEIAKIMELAMEYPLVTYVHDIVVHRYGKKNFISLHAESPSSLSIYEMHDLAADVSENIVKWFPGECVVHMDPIDKESERYQEVAAILNDLVTAKHELIEFHDLHFRENSQREIIHCEFSVDPKLDQSTYGTIHDEMIFYLKNIFKNSEIKFSLEPGYNVVRPNNNTNDKNPT